MLTPGKVLRVEQVLGAHQTGELRVRLVIPDGGTEMGVHRRDRLQVPGCLPDRELRLSLHHHLEEVATSPVETPVWDVPPGQAVHERRASLVLVLTEAGEG